MEKKNQDKDPAKQQMPGIKSNMMLDRVHGVPARLNQYEVAVWKVKTSALRQQRQHSLHTCSDFKTANTETEGQTSKPGVLQRHEASVAKMKPNILLVS